MSTQEFKRKLTAVFSADVAGYSRLMVEDEAATVKTLEAYKQIMFALIKQNRGRVVDSPGDNLLAEFASVVDAVQCAVAVQKELEARNADLPENRRMQFRIGINLGDVIEEEDRIYGDGVNIAARLEALADPGGICVSKTAFLHIESKLPLGYEFLGEQEVKNVVKPVGAYKVLMEPRVTGAGVKEKKPTISILRRKLAFAGAVAFVVLIIGLAFWNFYWRAPKIERASKEKMAFSLPDKPSLAVLPFDNLSGDKDQDYIADGLTENIIDALANIPELFIVARHATLNYKGKQVNIRQISEELGVQYVLEGSIQKSGKRIRVTAQLIDALKGDHVWSGKYDRELEELFAVQDDITLNIAKVMELKLTEGEQARIRHSTNNLDAWSLASRAKGLFENYSPDDNLKARELFKKAVELDPNYSYAWVYLAWTHFIDGYHFSHRYDQKESFRHGAEIAHKVLNIDDKLSDAYALLSFVYLTQNKFDEARVAGDKAIALGPNDSENHAIVAIVMQSLGDGEAVINLIKRAIRLDPYSPNWYWFRLSCGYMLLGRYEEAASILEAEIKKIEKSKTPVSTFGYYMWLGVNYSLMGRMDEARANVKKAIEIDPKRMTIEVMRRTMMYKDAEYEERLLDALRKAGVPESG